MKVSIPQPCSEDWSAMKIGLHTRFCDSCQKNVMDFTQKSRQEILEYLLENLGKKVCGRITPGQLDFSHTDILVTIRVLTKKQNDTNLPFYLLAAGALVLSSCNETENRQREKITIETSETSDEQKMEQPQIELIEKPSSSIKEHHYELEIMGGIESPVLVYPEPIVEDIVGMVTVDSERYPDKMPEFVGGIDSLMQYVEKTLKYPRWERKHKIEGTVYVEFVVNESGKILNPVIIESVSGSKNFDKEVIRLVKKKCPIGFLAVPMERLHQQNLECRLNFSCEFSELISSISNCEKL